MLYSLLSLRFLIQAAKSCRWFRLQVLFSVKEYAVISQPVEKIQETISTKHWDIHLEFCTKCVCSFSLQYVLWKSQPSREKPS